MRWKRTGYKPAGGGFEALRRAHVWSHGLLDATLWVPATYLAVASAPDTTAALGAIAAAAIVAGVVQLAVGLLQGVYRGRYRTGSFEEAGGVALTSMTAGVALFVSSLVAIPDVRLPPVLAAVAFQMTVSLAFRYLTRVLRERTEAPQQEPSQRILIFGAGEAGYLAAQLLRREAASDSVIVGFIDDDRGKRNLRLGGHRVLGDRTQMPQAIAATGSDTLLVAIPSASRDVINEVADQAQGLGLRVSLLPPLSQIVSGPIRVADIHEITLADFLSRDEIHLDKKALSQLITGKRILVTGAGGSIGSQICATVNEFAPAALYKLDSSERGLYELEMRMSGRFAADERSILANIRDEARMLEVFSDLRPDVVFHAAAHKHVPFLEAHPQEAYLTNVVGSYNVLAAAEKTGVETFVNISTDKAADPINVLGYSKRLAERLTATVARRTGRNYMSVRFGNVLGSDGSVIATFRSQLSKDKPLTITHPDVTRYFMTIPEAVQLVLQAGALGGDGDVMVLDMGEPVRIMDLARRLAAELKPGVFPEFEVVGLRPGEKLHEVLFADDEVRLSSPHPLLHRFQVPELDTDFVGIPLNVDSRALGSMATWEGTHLPDEMLPTRRNDGPASRSLD